MIRDEKEAAGDTVFLAKEVGTLLDMKPYIAGGMLYRAREWARSIRSTHPGYKDSEALRLHAFGFGEKLEMTL
jgi:hypothetical protein